MHRALILSLLVADILFAGILHADNGHDAWLRYAPQPGSTAAVVATLNNSVVTNTARGELIRGLGTKNDGIGCPQGRRPRSGNSR